MIVWRGLDLVGALLCEQPGIAGLTFCAVGTGDPAWPDPPPRPRRIDAALVAETFRKRLRPGDVTIDAGTGDLVVTVTLEGGEAMGELRELALLGGDASPRPGSGWPLVISRHAPIAHGAEDELRREVRVHLAEAMGEGARSVAAALLARGRGAAGIRWAAVGTGTRGDPPPAGLAAEAARRPLTGRALSYDPGTRRVSARVAFPYTEAPGTVREVGLFAGATATEAPGSGTLVAYRTHAPVDRSRPAELVETLTMNLSAADAVSVPDVTGKLLAAAITALDAGRLAGGRVTERTDDAHPHGTILEQRPAAGTSAHPGWAIDMVASIPTQVVVPPLVGAPAAAAAELLQPAGLTVDEAGSTTQESEQPAGTVLAVEPPTGTVVDKGSSVRLVTAVPITVAVPDLRGQSPDAAAALLAGTTLVLAAPPYATRESSLTVGTILEQTPAAGARAVRGTAVAVVLATGWTVAAPDVVGQSVDDAGAAIVAAGDGVLAQLGRAAPPPGLTLGARAARESTAAPGTVVEQFPKAGQHAPLYGTVDVFFAVAPTHEVPGVVGLSQVDAATAIVGAGLVVGEITTRMQGDPTDPGDATAAGTVLEQRPAPGTRWPEGAAIELVVATPVTAAVPDVTGRSLDVARETLEGRTFTVGAVTPEVTEGTAGTVRVQDPEPGSRAPLGTGVALTVVAGVPNLIGLTVDGAKPLCDALGLGFAQKTQESSAKTGTIVGQDPPAGTAAEVGMTVTVTVAVPITVAVPDLTGILLDDARARLAAIGLGLVVSATVESDAPSGSILDQKPKGGERVTVGTAVAVQSAVPFVSPTVAVPDVGGMDVARATAALRSQGLVLAVLRREASDRPANTVLSEDPAAGTVVNRHTNVNVVLAASPDEFTVIVPDVRGAMVDAATAALANASLVADRVDQQSTAAAGTVLSQMPLPGGRVPRGSHVSLTVASVPRVAVPDVVGDLLAVAQRAIVNAGLKAQIVRSGLAPARLTRELPITRLLPIDDGGGGGRTTTVTTVAAQRPDGGTFVAVGSTVVLTVVTEVIDDR